jgi:hypothetical protein
MTILDLAQAHPMISFVYLCLLIMTFSPYVREPTNEGDDQC